MIRAGWIGLVALGCAVVFTPVVAAPPFSGTVFIDPDIITESDPTVFSSLAYDGRGLRTMFDRRVNDWVQENAYLFTAEYSDGREIEIQVNPEFGSREAAQAEAEFYAPVFGRLPGSLRRDVETSWIHRGDEVFGGGNNNLLIHTGSIAQGYMDDGVLEEVFVHEAAHTSLDADHASTPGWLAAQQSDPEFISNWARDHPGREDIAESFLPYLAVRYRADRISSELAGIITDTIPARLAYFDGLELDLHPMVTADFAINPGLNDAWFNADTAGQGFFIIVFEDTGIVFLAWFTYDTALPPDDVEAFLGAAGHRWLTAQGPYEGDTATLDVFLTQGGIFDMAEPEPVTGQDPIGTITIVWTDCENGVLSYDIDSPGVSGEIPIIRIVPDNVALCEALAIP